MNTAILDRAIAVAKAMTEDEQIVYIEGIAQRWDNQAAVDYIAKVLFGT
jgi:hypothetical protein